MDKNNASESPAKQDERFSRVLEVFRKGEAHIQILAGESYSQTQDGNESRKTFLEIRLFWILIARDQN